MNGAAPLFGAIDIFVAWLETAGTTVVGVVAVLVVPPLTIVTPRPAGTDWIESVLVLTAAGGNEPVLPPGFVTGACVDVTGGCVGAGGVDEPPPPPLHPVATATNVKPSAAEDKRCTNGPFGLGTAAVSHVAFVYIELPP